MAGVAWETTAQIVSDAAIELGLASADVADPFSSANGIEIVRLTRLLKGLGRQLTKDRQWTHLQKSATLSLVNGTYVYALPADYDRIIDQTHWNRTTRLPAGGPIDAQLWEYFQALTSSPTLTVLFRTVNNEIWVYPTPTSSQTIGYEYVSSYWVKPTGQSAPTASTTTDKDDTLYFDPLLLVLGLKVRYLKSTQQDTAAAQDEYRDRLLRVTAQDGGAPQLNITRGVDAQKLPLVGERNVPITGFGT